MDNIVSWDTQTGAPIQIDDVTIKPQSQYLQIKLPFGGFVWQRPSNIIVERDGRVEQIPVPDVTRLALWSLAGLTILFNLVIFIKRSKS